MKNHIVLFTGLLVFLSAGCSINQMAMRSDNPEFIGDQFPRIIKSNEAKLEKRPDDQKLILSAGSMYIMYANAFIQGPAELLPRDQHAERQEAFARAKILYLKGADLLYGGLNRKYPGLAGSYQAGKLSEILEKMNRDDVPSLYWIAAGYLSAFSLNPFDMELGIKVPELIRMIDRAYELDPDFNSGALDDFYVLFHASVPESMGGDKTRVETHYQRSLEKSKRLLAGPYISYAQAVCVPAQDYTTFKANLEKALEIDPDRDKNNRLVNTLNQRKARYLLDSAAFYFIGLDAGDWDDWGDEELDN